MLMIQGCFSLLGFSGLTKVNVVTFLLSLLFACMIAWCAQVILSYGSGDRMVRIFAASLKDILNTFSYKGGE